MNEPAALEYAAPNILVRTHMLKRLLEDFNERGMAHPVITRRLEERIGQISVTLTQPSDSFQRLVQQ